jgi:hypothetical protein
MRLTVRRYGVSIDVWGGIGLGLSSREGCQVRSLRLALASLLAAAVLIATSGCSGDPSPDSSASASASTQTTSPSPTESVTASPKPHSPIKFVRAWVDAENVAINSGDVTPLLTFEAQSCFNCKQLLKPIKRIYGAGGFIHSKGWRMEHANAVDSGGNSVLVTMLVATSVEIVRPSEGAPIERHKPDKLGFSLTLTPKAGLWVITEVLID